MEAMIWHCVSEEYTHMVSYLGCIGIFILFKRAAGWHSRTCLPLLLSIHTALVYHTDKQSLSVPPYNRRDTLRI